MEVEVFAEVRAALGNVFAYVFGDVKGRSNKIPNRSQRAKAVTVEEVCPINKPTITKILWKWSS